FTVAYTAAQEARARASVSAAQSRRYTDVRLLEADEAVAKINVAETRAARWHPHAARIQPAKLASGLAAAVERLGVEIYENTRVVEITPHKLHTTHGTVTADYIVRATEG